MASRIEHQSSVTLGGVAALCAAIGLCALGIGQQTRPVSASPVLILSLLACGGGLIVVLARVRLPQTVKMGCILATLCVMFLTVATGDLFGVKSTTRKIDKATAGDSSDDAFGGSAGKSIADPAARARPGAAVRLVSASEGDLGWASRINGTLNGRIGGDSSGWLTIDGRVLAHEDHAKRLVMIQWSISGSSQSAKCGATSINGRDPDANSRSDPRHLRRCRDPLEQRGPRDLPVILNG